MLPMPAEPGPDIIRIVGIDPGTDTLGAAILDVDINKYEVTVVWGHTFHAVKAADRNSTYTDMLGFRFERLRTHAVALTELYNAVQPTLVAAESPFLKYGRATAFEALVECYMVLKRTLYDYSKSMLLHRVDPVTAKNYVGVDHKKTDKEDVRHGVIKHFHGKLAEGLTFDMFDEHTIDAIAVANVMYRKKLLGDIVVATKKPKAAKRVKSNVDGVSVKKKRRKRRGRKWAKK